MNDLNLNNQNKLGKMDNHLTTADIICSIVCMVLSGILLLIAK